MQQLQELHLEAFIPLLAREVFGAQRVDISRRFFLGKGVEPNDFGILGLSKVWSRDCWGWHQNLPRCGGTDFISNLPVKHVNWGNFGILFWKKKHSVINDGLPFGSIIGIGLSLNECARRGKMPPMPEHPIDFQRKNHRSQRQERLRCPTSVQWCMRQAHLSFSLFVLPHTTVCMKSC